MIDNRKTEKPLTMFAMSIALISVLFSGWNTYTIHVSEKFKRPLDKQTAFAESYERQIKNAEKRGDEKEVLRLRLESEKSEENFRERQKISATIKQNINLDPAQVNKTDKLTVENWVSNIDNYLMKDFVYSPTMLGDAWFIANDYEKAVNNYEIALEKNPYDSISLLKRARAVGHLAENIDDISIQSNKYASAIDSTEKALALIEGAVWDSAWWSSYPFISQENSQEAWKASTAIKRNINLSPAQVNKVDKLAVENWINNIANNSAENSIHNPIMLGDAWFIINDYEKAVNNYEIALKKNPYDSISLLKRARAVGYLAESIENPNLQSNKYASAVDSTEKALALIEGTVWDSLPPYIFMR